MLQLNLISEELREDIKLRHIYKMLKRAIFFLMIITIFIAIIFLISKIILQNSFNKIVEQTTLITKSSQGRNTKIREINTKIDYVDEIQGDYIEWSYLVEDLAKNINNDVTFNSIKINREEKNIDLKGVAKSRDSLLLLRQGLDNSSMFANIDFPISNILEKEDINFEIKADLNLANIN